MAFEKKIDGETLYKGIIVDVSMDHAELINGDIVRREVVHHPGGVTIIPVEEDGTVWCVRQFRYPMQREMLEVPAGKLEYGEKPLPAAERELGEETGLTAGRMVYLGRVLHVAGLFHRGAAYISGPGAPARRGASGRGRIPERRKALPGDPDGHGHGRGDRRRKDYYSRAQGAAVPGG